MSNSETTADALDADVKRHLKLCQEGGTLPNVMFLATKHNVPVSEVETRMRALTVNAPKLEGQREGVS
jgi:hypothetical protein